MTLIRALLLVSAIWLHALPALAEVPPKSIIVYFDAAGTQRIGTPTVVGDIINVYIYLEGFAGYLGGAQYAIDYGPNLEFIADVGTPHVTIGNSQDGISIGFGLRPLLGTKAMVHGALCKWVGDCATYRNADGPTPIPNPYFPDPSPAVTTFWYNKVIAAEPARAQTCQQVELDIKPGACPNPFSAKVWKNRPNANGGVLQVALLGSATVDVRDIDVSSLMLEGVAPLQSSRPRRGGSHDDDSGRSGPAGYGPRVTHAGTAGENTGCECAPPGPHDDGSGKGRGRGGRDQYEDLLLHFNKRDIAAAIGPDAPYRGEQIELTLMGAYLDGLPFGASDCIMIVGGEKPPEDNEDDGSSGKEIGKGDLADLGFPQPNPFNPVTRIGYSIPATQRVHIAVYDVAGRRVETLVDEVKSSGEYVVEWHAGGLPSGVYFYRMQTAGATLIRRATLIK